MKSTVTLVPFSSPISLQGCKHTLFTISAVLEKEKGIEYASARIPKQSTTTNSRKRMPEAGRPHLMFQTDKKNDAEFLEKLTELGEFSQKMKLLTARNKR